MTQPILAITLGDPRGVGAEIVRKALADPRVAGACRCVVVGPSGLECAVDQAVGEWHPRQSEANAGRLAGKAIERAVAMCQAGDADALVTAPIDKHALLAGGYDYPGHTEMLSKLTGREVAMMLASDRLRVVLATTHVPLRDVPALLTAELISRIARSKILITASGRKARSLSSQGFRLISKQVRSMPFSAPTGQARAPLHTSSWDATNIAQRREISSSMGH